MLQAAQQQARQGDALCPAARSVSRLLRFRVFPIELSAFGELLVDMESDEVFSLPLLGRFTRAYFGTLTRVRAVTLLPIMAVRHRSVC